MKTKKRSYERGVAVLFSLGILGMMTVLALTFASISMTNQTIAKNISNQNSARELAYGILQRVKYILDHSGYDTDAEDNPKAAISTPLQLQNFYSKETGSGATAHFDWIWKLGMTGTDIESALYRTDEVCNYSNPNILPTWQYIKGADNKIIGRFAYVVRATDLPVIDLNTAFLTDTNTNQSGNDDQYKRLGKSLSELKPDIVYEAARTKLGISSPTNFSAISGSFLSAIQSALNSKRMTSYADFESTLPALGENKLNFSKVIANSYTPSSVKYPEVFLSETGTALYRFDLSQISSVSGEDNRKKLVEKMVGGDGELPSGWTNADTTNPIKIPWLADFTDSDGGYDNAQHKAKQIAANIVDFFSTDDTPTSDVANGSWFTTTPKYIGLKKTPFLYGFGGEAELVVNQTEYTNPPPESTKYYKQTASFKFTPKVGICNFYSCPNTLQIGVSAKFRITFQISGSGISTENKEITIDYPGEGGGSYEIIELNSGSFPTAAGYHYNLDFKSKTVALSEYTAAKNTTITMISLGYKAKVGLKYNGKWVDFSEIRNFKGDGTLKSIGFSASDTGNKKTINTTGFQNFKYPLTFRVSDPRHNLFESQWGGRCHTKNDNAQQWKDLLNASSGTENLYGDCVSRTPVDHDYLSSAAATQQAAYTAVPKNPDNAYVYFPTAGSTITPWEIGQIHRGYAWQTINLKKFKETNPTKGGSYSDGDANLLDQVRMTSNADTYGKIPLNEIWGQNNALFDTLQRNAVTGEPTPSVTAGTNEFRNTNFNLTPFFDTRKTASPHYFTYRGELAKILTYSTTYHILASNPTSDAAKEELFAKCVMLFDVEQTFLPRRVYVFGIAQTIQDINGSVNKAWNNDGNFSNNAGATAIGKFNAGYRTASGVDVGGASYPNSGLLSSTFEHYVNGVDKILSEQKIFAILEREYTLVPYSKTNRPKWKIVRFEYVQ